MGTMAHPRLWEGDNLGNLGASPPPPRLGGEGELLFLEKGLETVVTSFLER